MREILFRGKRVDNGEWAYGYYAVIGNPLTIDGLPLKHLICNRTNVFNYEVVPETIGQYTGLTDKNGIKIFEGDIVKFFNYIDEIYHEEIGVCVFEQDESNFCLQRVEHNPANYSVPITTHTIYLINNRTYKEDVYYKVIGNIFDNPELMEV